MPFTPYPEDAEVHDSFDTVPLDEPDEEDGDDSLTPRGKPPLIDRIVAKVRRG